MQQTKSQNVEDPQKESHLKDYLNIVWRRWKLTLLLAVLVFSGVAVYTFLQQPVYRAEVTLNVRQKTPDDVLAQQLQKEAGGLNAEIQWLLSRQLAEDVAAKLNLNWQYETNHKGLRVEITELKIDRRYPQITIEFVEKDSLRVYGGDGQAIGTVSNNALFDKDGVRLRLSVSQASPGDRFSMRQLPPEQAALKVQNGLFVYQASKGSGSMLIIAVERTKPDEARDVANAIAQVYYERNIASKTAEAGKMLTFVDQQLNILGGELDLSEEELQSYKITTGLKRLSTVGDGLVSGAVELEKQKAALILDRKQIEYFISSPAANGYDFTLVEEVPGVASAAAKILELRAEQTDLLKDFTEAHPEVVSVSDQIRRVRSSILSYCRLDINRINQKIMEIESALAESEKKLEQVPQEELELARMTRANTVNAELYTYLLKRQQEARISEASTTSNIEIIDSALTPTKPVRPNKKKNLALGLILGLMLGVGAAFLLEYMDQTIKTVEDVKELLNLSIYGIIPRIPFADQDRDLPSKQLVTTLSAKSPVIEAFRALRTNLNFATAKQKHQLIMITSSLPNEGKSTVSGNLAVILAQTGAKVLLMGCDLRRPSLYQMFDQPAKPGLTELIINQDQAGLRHLDSPKIDLLPAGSIPPNPAEILDSGRFKKLLEMLRERYDYVVIDAPPVLPVTDSQILAPLVDRVLIVIEPCRVPISAAQQMLDSLRAVNANILGVILNDKSGRGFKYYGNYQYYGNKYYRGYYGESHDKPDGAVVGGFKKVWEKLNS